MDELRSPPQPGVVSRQALEQLEAHVLRRMQGRTYHLEVELGDAGWIIRGRVKTYHAKQLLLHALRDATSLPILVTEIEVR